MAVDFEHDAFCYILKRHGAGNRPSLSKNMNKTKQFVFFRSVFILAHRRCEIAPLVRSAAGLYQCCYNPISACVLGRGLAGSLPIEKFPEGGQHRIRVTRRWGSGVRGDVFFSALMPGSQCRVTEFGFCKLFNWEQAACQAGRVCTEP